MTVILCTSYLTPDTSQQVSDKPESYRLFFMRVGMNNTQMG